MFNDFMSEDKFHISFNVISLFVSLFLATRAQIATKYDHRQVDWCVG